MASVFDYIFNIGGNFSAKIDGMSAATGKFSASVEGADNGVRKFTGSLATFSYLKDVFQNVAEGVTALSSAGVKLNRQMHDLSAVAGVTGEGLKQIEKFARQSAKAFGTDASVAVEGYKLLLSQLSPELGKYPDALSAMGDCIQTTSKLMGGDGVAAAQVLTTAMNQYGVSMENPTAAAGEMARMMNVMAAAGQAGSAELPAISAALQQCGMAAKAANVSFEETNAAIQVLDKAGKKASEGGVALRNVLGQLSKGRFVEKQAREELEKAGIDVVALGDNSKSLKERLDMLKPMLNDSALLSKFFGVENANAARALIQGTDALQGFTEAVTDTNSATEQAAVIMDSYAERQARVNQQFEDIKISIFQATGDLSLWCGVVTSALVPLAQIYPLLESVWKLMLLIKGLNWAGMWLGVVKQVRSAVISFAIMNATLSTTDMFSLGFAGNIGRATIALVKFATVGVFNAIKGLGTLVLSYITGGTASTTFAATASTSFGVFATTASAACRAVSVAIASIPIIGWVAVIVSALIALGVYFWNTSAKFRAVLKGTWSAFKACFTGIADMAKTVFGSIGDLIKAAFSLDFGGISNALEKLKAGFSDYGKQIGQAFNAAYDAEMSDSAKKQAAEKKKKPAANTSGAAVPDVAVPTVNPTGNTLSGASGASTGSGTGSDGGKIKNITISIDKLIERFELHTATVGESVEQMKAVVLETLMGALNDTELTTS
ncbi:MAG: phage tail tape measure protein [Muribaculaceae bacterium]|nr:phage tail tape measure protein [Muribaculaceae bacterium]